MLKNKTTRPLRLSFALILLALALTACRPSFSEYTQTAVAARPAATVTRAPSATPGDIAVTAAPTVAPVANSAPAGNIANGISVFNGVGQCYVCHTVDGSNWAAGPDLKGLPAQLVAQGLDPEAFLHESIVDVLAVITEGYSGDLMPKNYDTLLTPEQIQDLVAYMMSL